MRRAFQLRSLLVALVFTTFVGEVRAEDSWLEWRGNDGQGHSTAVNLPTRWTSDSSAWRTEVPGHGWSTPVIANGEIWLTTAVDTRANPAERKRRQQGLTTSQPLIISSHASFHAISLDLKTGKIKENIKVLDEEDPQYIQIDNSYATPSPILDGDRLYCHFGTSGMGAVDIKTGKVLWTNRTMVVKHENGPGSSPVLWNDLLIVHCDGIDIQYIVAINKNTGDIAWKTTRTGELHENPQLRKAYATPLIVSIDGKDQVISPGADWLYGYDPASGKELWKLHYGELGFSNSARPVTAHGLIYICTGFMKSRLLAIRPGTNGKSAEIVWTYDKQIPAVSSPIVVGDEIYFASGKGIGTCLDAKTGKPHWVERIGTSIWAPPIFADGRLYFFDKSGSTAVIGVGTKFERIANNKLDEKIQASGSAVDGNLLIRTQEALYSFQK